MEIKYRWLGDGKDGRLTGEIYEMISLGVDGGVYFDSNGDARTASLQQLNGCLWERISDGAPDVRQTSRRRAYVASTS